MNRRLVVGIDPGTTVGYAALDLTGAVVAVGSGRGLDRDAVIAEFSRHGSPLVAGTDKGKPPGFVAEIATTFGARLVHPDEDIAIVEKRELTAGMRSANDHEMDALAAACFAFRKVEPVLGRIRRFAAAQRRPELFEDLADLVIRKGISIKAAFDVLAAPTTPAVRIVREIRKRGLTENDYWTLYDELIASKEAIALLRQQNRKLTNLARRVKGRIKELKERPAALPRPAAPVLSTLKQELARLRAVVAREGEKSKRLEAVLANLPDVVIAKRLPNLGWHSYRGLARTVGIRKGDILLVADAAGASERTAEALAGTVDLVLYGKPPSVAQLQDAPFALLPAQGLVLQEFGRLAVIDRKKLDEARKSRDVLRKVIQEYQARRR